MTFAATVKGNGGTPAGTVAFTDGATTLGTASLDNNGQATFVTPTLTVGSHAIAANYRVDSNSPGSSTTLTQTVNPKKTGTTTALKASKNPSKPGESVTFIASVMPSDGSGLPTGAVTFLDGSTALGTGPLDKSGRIAFATPKLAVGQHHRRELQRRCRFRWQPIERLDADSPSVRSSADDFNHLPPTGTPSVMCSPIGAALAKQADDQRRKGKDAQNATKYRNQPNGPAMAVLDNLNG